MGPSPSWAPRNRELKAKSPCSAVKFTEVSYLPTNLEAQFEVALLIPCLPQRKEPTVAEQ